MIDNNKNLVKIKFMKNKQNKIYTFLGNFMSRLLQCLMLLIAGVLTLAYIAYFIYGLYVAFFAFKFVHVIIAILIAVVFVAIGDTF